MITGRLPRRSVLLLRFVQDFREGIHDSLRLMGRFGSVEVMTALLAAAHEALAELRRKGGVGGISGGICNITRDRPRLEALIKTGPAVARPGPFSLG